MKIEITVCNNNETMCAEAIVKNKDNNIKSFDDAQEKLDGIKELIERNLPYI